MNNFLKKQLQIPKRLPSCILSLSTPSSREGQMNSLTPELCDWAKTADNMIGNTGQSGNSSETR